MKAKPESWPRAALNGACLMLFMVAVCWLANGGAKLLIALLGLH